MKTIILTVAILTSSLINAVQATKTVNMNELLEESVTFDNSLNLKKDQTEFVRISFKINKDGQIEILDMNYSNSLIKDQLVKQIKSLTINGIVDINETYYYNFSFKKK